MHWWTHGYRKIISVPFYEYSRDQVKETNFSKRKLGELPESYQLFSDADIMTAHKEPGYDRSAFIVLHRSLSI